VTVLVIATRNEGKRAEFERLLDDASITLKSVRDFPDLAEVEEDGKTFEENARKKALAVARATGLCAVADDSGLEVDALGGAPGIRSARWSGAGDEANNEKLLQELARRPGAPRTARFRAVVAVAWPSGEVEVGHGTCEGTVGAAARGHNGFGYDPLFVVTGEGGRTYAQLSAQEKDRHSHRARAVRALWPRVRDRLTADPGRVSSRSFGSQGGTR
jgi:XTP/dITP diphosphohydrolase